MKVFVVINTGLGWDNIIGIFDSNMVTEPQLRERYSREDDYLVLNCGKVQTQVDEF